MAASESSVLALGGVAFVGLTEGQVTPWLTIVEERLTTDTGVWGAMRDTAVEFLTLHYVQQFVLSGGAGGLSGAVTGQSVGSVSVSYARGTSRAEADYGTTAWGQAYQTLVRSLGLGITVASTASTLADTQ